MFTDLIFFVVFCYIFSSFFVFLFFFRFFFHCMCVCISCSCSFFLSFVTILHICLNIRDKNQKRFVTYLKGFLCFHVFFMFIFLLFFSFLLIGEKVNTQWLSHAIFDPVVSWSYFLSFVLFHDFFLFSLFVLLVSVCVLLWLWWREWWWLGDFQGVVVVGLGWFGNCGSCLSKFHVFAIACVWVYFVWMFCCFAQ